MHPLCYYRIDNIEVEPQQPTSWELKALDILVRVPTMRHAELDEIEAQHFRLRLRTKRREVLVQRRATVTHMLQASIRNSQVGAINAARRAKFIGPLTIQMQNGHPF